MRHLERRHHFLGNHVENGDIEMRYIDRERERERESWLTFSSNPLVLLDLLIYGGKLVFTIPMSWFDGEL
jgi:hypothetical protein